mmetsp:Transcript_90861/g.189966  ORF Transcript_90861/g.189966 Transcript_90861/m.189966 type:complete len:163 (+) Transcript_90861:141-629(+)
MRAATAAAAEEEDGATVLEEADDIATENNLGSVSENGATNGAVHRAGVATEFRRTPSGWKKRSNHPAQLEVFSTNFWLMVSRLQRRLPRRQRRHLLLHLMRLLPCLLIQFDKRSWMQPSLQQWPASAHGLQRSVRVPKEQLATLLVDGNEEVDGTRAALNNQ